MTVSALRPPRVLHVLEATLGGTLRYMENIADATDGLDIVSAFAYGTARADSRLGPFLKRISNHGWTCYPVDMRREVKPWTDLKAWFQLRCAVDHFAPDIIHCHSSKAGALGRASVFLRREHPARVYSPHALAAPLGSIYLKIEKLLSRSTERFVAVSDTERKEILDYSLAAEDSVSVVYPSVDVGHFQPSSRQNARQTLGIGSSPLILAIGRLTAQKDPVAFLRVMEHLHARQPDVRAIWVGSGEGETEFLSKIAAAQMQDVVRVVPWQHDVRLYIAAADVLLSTSRFESFGYVAAEALAMERPVVASDVTGTRDIMRRRFGEWLYPLDRSDLAAELILKLLKDPALSVATGDLGRSQIEKLYSIQRMRESLVQAYGAVLNQPIPELIKHPAVA
ncbi:glycosyltransferase [Tunturiibacter gelidiferens]|uniref:glycosyltransferase n=1 Tax=Tunturiibacter gelidiferens TaxID=3069689 RepID=UPI003D9AC667